jgi:hypothetical protein
MPFTAPILGELVTKYSFVCISCIESFEGGLQM